jgi:hypothetical protein
MRGKQIGKSLMGVGIYGYGIFDYWRKMEKYFLNFLEIEIL